MIKPVTKSEVYNALRAMLKGKSPGPDGITMEFYLFNWNIIGDHLFNVVVYFFNSCKLLISWGKTFVALIPNNENPQKVTDFALSPCAMFLIKLFPKF